MSHNNSGSSGSILMKLFPVNVPEAGVITRVQFLEGPPPKISEGEKKENVTGKTEALPSGGLKIITHEMSLHKKILL